MVWSRRLPKRRRCAHNGLTWQCTRKRKVFRIFGRNIPTYYRYVLVPRSPCDKAARLRAHRHTTEASTAPIRFLRGPPWIRVLFHYHILIGLVSTAFSKGLIRLKTQLFQKVVVVPVVAVFLPPDVDWNTQEAEESCDACHGPCHVECTIFSCGLSVRRLANGKKINIPHQLMT